VRPICVDHLKLPVGALERSPAFYRAALVEGMGMGRVGRRRVAELRARGGRGPDHRGGGGPFRPTIHLAFAATDFAQVEGFHRAGLAAGGRDNGAPGPRSKYSPGYHGAFLLDPDGHDVEAVWHAPVEDG